MSNLGYPSTSIGFLLAYYGGVDMYAGKNSGFDLVENCYSKLFDFDFPFYVENEKIKVEFEKYLCYTYFNESIGFETPDAWKFAFKQKMLEIMPYYKELYRTTLFEYEPLINRVFTSSDKVNETNITDYTNDSKHNNSAASNSNGHGNSTSDNQSITSDAPQINFSQNDYASDLVRGQTKKVVENSDATLSNDSGNTNIVSKNIDDKNRILKHEEKGFSGSYQEEIKKIRENILNINKMICDDCCDLFMLIY
jgi:hypothetical protein